MTYARIPDFSQSAPVRSAPTGRVSINDRCRTVLNERAAGTDAAVALLPLLELQWDKHVKARRAVRADETPERIAKAEGAFEACSAVAEAVINGPMPRSLAGLRALSFAVSCGYEGCLDRSDPVHNALWQLVCAVAWSTGGDVPEGFETFSQEGFAYRR
ncbi:hypothetical protein ME121_6446 [Methylobacterium sp. ME121]|nr:hypothetical protein ME121_6446 [Methylobacterium sp. ME121]